MLKWTKEPPTKEGYYWFNDSEGTVLLKVELNLFIRKFIYWIFGWEIESLLSEVNGYWQGPIPIPEPPEE